VKLDPEAIPADYEVQPIDPDDPAAKSPATCGTCGLTWDDGAVTSMTPAPSARCPFEAFHEDEPEQPRDYDSDAGVRLTFDTLTDRGYERPLRARRLRGRAVVRRVRPGR
jgi:hypothetical protein